MPAERLAFGRFRLNAENGTLLRDGALLTIGQKSALILGALLNSKGEVLTKAQLMDAAWPGIAVEQSNLSVQIASLRKALGAAPDGGEWIVTVPRVGYRLFVEAQPPKPPAATADTLEPITPSLAVLPFENLGGNSEQDYFADGVVEDIIVALSRFKSFAVIARNSSFVYKGRPTDVRQVGRELGARYVLEGSVRRSGDKLRITGQLINTSTGANLWADRFDGEREDIFDLQDQVTARVAGAIASKLEQAEIVRSRRKPTESLDAYDYYLRGMAALHLWTRDGNNEALSLFAQAIALDADFAPAFGMAARCYSQRVGSGWTIDRPREVAEAERLGRRAVALGQDDAVALSGAGLALAYVVGDLDTGAALIERALSFNPNLAWAWSFSGFVKAWLGESDVAIEHVERALRLSPNDPHVYSMRTHLGFAHFVAGRIAEALTWAELTSRERPDHPFNIPILAACYAIVGRQEEAEKIMVRLRQLYPALLLSNLKSIYPFRDAEVHERLAAGLRKAGLPE